MKLTTNLATRRYVNLRQLDTVLALVFAGLISLALYQVAQLSRNAAEISRLTSLTKGIGVTSAGPQVSDAQLKAQAKKIQFANALIDQKSMKWLTLLDRLEEVVPPGVTFTAIEPDLKKSVKLNGSVRNFASLRMLLENMERSKNFSEVYLLSQSEAKVGLTQEGMAFQITCRIDLK